MDSAELGCSPLYRLQIWMRMRLTHTRPSGIYTITPRLPIRSHNYRFPPFSASRLLIFSPVLSNAVLISPFFHCPKS